MPSVLDKCKPVAISNKFRLPNVSIWNMVSIVSCHFYLTSDNLYEVSP